MAVTFQASFNAVIRHHLEGWANAAAAAGRNADARALLYANGAQARMCPFSACVGQGPQWTWNFVGAREDCKRLGSRRRHLLLQLWLAPPRVMAASAPAPAHTVRCFVSSTVEH